MKISDQKSHSNGPNLLSVLLIAAISLVACATGWVAWTCLDSAQKEAGKLSKLHVTTDNTQVDSHRYDIVNKEMDTKVFSGHQDPELAIQEAVFKLNGSEISFSKGLTFIEQRQYRQAAASFSKVILQIPAEAGQRTTWRAAGRNIDRKTYTAYAYQQRSLCYLHTDKVAQAIADLTAAIKLRPGYRLYYEDRAKAYYMNSDKVHGDADAKTAGALPEIGATIVE